MLKKIRRAIARLLARLRRLPQPAPTTGAPTIMTALSVIPPYPVFFDSDGQPLEDGYIWIGQAYTTPQNNLIAVYFDDALTIPAQQPLRTINGYVSRNGSPAQLYIDGVNYSISVQDKNGAQLYIFPDGSGINPNAAGITYNPAGVGAVATTVQAKLRESVSVTDFGAVGDGVTDDTVAIQNAFTAALRVYFPQATYLVSSLDIPANRTLDTESIDVRFKQQSGQPVGTRVLKVMGANVNIGDCTIEGNILTDTNEQNHGIVVATQVAGVPLSNITIGNVKGINIRGDVVYVGQQIASGTTKNVRIKSADGNNILRNVVSVVGAEDVYIGQVTGPAVGYYHVDIEPDSALTGGCTNIHVGQVKGRHIGILANTASINTINQNIRFDEVNLDPSFATQSTPAYTPGASIAARAVHLRNVRSAFIGSLRVNGFDGSAIWEVSGGIEVESLVIDQAALTECTLVDGSTYAYVVCKNVTFNYLYATTTASPGAVTPRIIGANNCAVLSGNFALGPAAAVVRSANFCTLQNCVITGTTGYVVNNADDTILKNCSISGIDRLVGFSNGLTVDSCTATLSIAAINASTKIAYIRSTIQSQYYAFATGERDYTEAIALGSQFVWVDSTGDLRIKNGAPTSDTDGTVVGTQT